MNILLIEDTAPQAMIIESYVGFGLPEAQVTHEESLSGGIAQLRKNDYDVVLLDLGLPDAQGLETVTGIHQAGFDVPIVVLTAAGEDGLGMLCLQAGAQDFLKKTELSPDTLKKAIKYASVRRGEAGVLEVNQELSSLTGISQLKKSALADEMAEEYQSYLADHGLSDHGNAEAVATKLIQKGATADDLILLHVQALKALCKGAPERRLKYLVNRSRHFLLLAMTNFARKLKQ
ncbi:MAG: response regulator [Candidatus Eremiobacteraeota bacterium]|nr:response regulator [Candidatus Eremiobacteraeota bacterium]